ncbi:MAG: SDR family NAD(P)-dependent oxidoreductase [Agriterribacter sp.]
MARIFITGSADGLGILTAKALIQLGHQVVLHARNEQRGIIARLNAPGAENLVIADLSSIEETITLASKVNELGSFDVVIHNAGVYQVPANSVSKEGLSTLLMVNTIAPYILTSLIKKPQRLIYLSSGMHMQGNADLDFVSKGSSLAKRITYSDTKLHDVILAKAVPRNGKMFIPMR